MSVLRPPARSAAVLVSLGLLVLACKPGDDKASKESQGANELSEAMEENPLVPRPSIAARAEKSSHRWIDGFLPTPFGAFLEGLGAEGTRHLYPNLPPSALDPDQLGKLMPKRLVGLDRTRQFTGVMENESAAWVATLAEYKGDGVTLNLMIQDTAWEPTLLNPAIKQWVEAHHPGLEDGRPVARVGGEVIPGTALAVPVTQDTGSRILVVGHGLDEAGTYRIRQALAALDVSTLTEASSASSASAGWARGSQLPATESLARLALPERVAGLLPESLAGTAPIASGQGYRVDPTMRVRTEATRVFRSEMGLIELRIQDLGPAGEPVHPVGGSAGGVDQEDAKEAPTTGDPRCSEEYASCKWTARVEERLVWTAIWPLALRTDAPPELTEAFDAEAAADVIP